jgi:hypothetical protein
MKTVRLNEFLTREEIELAIKLWDGKGKMPPGGRYAQVIRDTIIAPNIERINKALGQENDPMFLAYAIEYVIGEEMKREREEVKGRDQSN